MSKDMPEERYAQVLEAAIRNAAVSLEGLGTDARRIAEKLRSVLKSDEDGGRPEVKNPQPDRPPGEQLREGIQPHRLFDHQGADSEE